MLVGKGVRRGRETRVGRAVTSPILDEVDRICEAPPPPRTDSELPPIPRLRSLTPVQMTVVVGDTPVDAEVPMVIEGSETVRP